ncbi:MAG: LysM domain-containing protein [Patescibacteria group bacterium]
MKRRLFYVLVLVLALVAVLPFSAAAERGVEPDSEWYLAGTPSPDIAAELYEGNTLFFVQRAFPVVDDELVSNHARVVYGPMLNPGTVFRVNGPSAITGDNRWVTGWFDNIGGEHWLFPADRLGIEYLDPNLPGEKDCTGQSIKADWFRTGGVNRAIRLGSGEDKVTAFLATVYPLIDAGLFQNGRRSCIVNLAKGTAVTVRTVLRDSDRFSTVSGRWAYVRLINGQEGLIPTNRLRLDLPPQEGLAAGGPRYYTVLGGDTMGAIAKRYGIKLPALISANQDVITDPNYIRPGWSLVLP